VQALLSADGEGFEWPLAKVRPLVVTKSSWNFGGPQTTQLGETEPPNLLDVLAIVAWASPSLIMNAISAEIDRLASDDGLSAEARADRLAMLAAEQLDLERADALHGWLRHPLERR
jgi:hypothetical protein